MLLKHVVPKFPRCWYNVLPSHLFTLMRVCVFSSCFPCVPMIPADMIECFCRRQNFVVWLSLICCLGDGTEWNSHVYWYHTCHSVDAADVQHVGTSDARHSTSSDKQKEVDRQLHFRVKDSFNESFYQEKTFSSPDRKRTAVGEENNMI